VQPAKAQALDDSLGPLGPLGDSSGSVTPQTDLPPVPPQKEQPPSHSLRQPMLAQPHISASRSTLDSIDLNDDAEPNARPRIPPPVQPPQGLPIRRETQPSVSIEQAAKPTFNITVGDPHKVGDITSSHTVYQVRTKVRDHMDQRSMVDELTVCRLLPKLTNNLSLR
jgi:sorting nexin-1/2